MAWDDLARAFALFLVFEGMIPFIAPSRWREMVLRISTVDDRVLRTGGLAMMIVGLILLQFA